MKNYIVVTQLVSSCIAIIVTTDRKTDIPLVDRREKRFMPEFNEFEIALVQFATGCAD